jgi:DNA-binding transcriptional MerR regulator
VSALSDREREPPVKLYYRIGEVSEIVGVEPHVLRYWETEFRSIRPQKSRKGQRIYSRRDVEKLLRVKDLLYNHGFTIAGARKRMRDPNEKTATASAPAAAQEAPVARAAPLEARGALLDIRREIVDMLNELALSGTQTKTIDAG